MSVPATPKNEATTAADTAASALAATGTGLSGARWGGSPALSGGGFWVRGAVMSSEGSAAGGQGTRILRGALDATGFLWATQRHFLSPSGLTCEKTTDVILRNIGTVDTGDRPPGSG